MTYFPFDKTKLETIDDANADEIDLIVNTAEKLCAYYQHYAKSLSEGKVDVIDPGFTIEEGALAGEIVESKNKFRTPKTKKGLATLKLFYGSQLDFYRHNPNVISVFGKNVRDLFLSMVFLENSLPPTYEPIDDYFQDAVRKMIVHFNRPGQNGPSGTDGAAGGNPPPP